MQINGYEINISSRDFIMLNDEILTQQMHDEILNSIIDNNWHGAKNLLAYGVRAYSAEKITTRIYAKMGLSIDCHILAKMIDGGISDEEIENKLNAK